MQSDARFRCSSTFPLRCAVNVFPVMLLANEYDYKRYKRTTQQTTKLRTQTTQSNTLPAGRPSMQLSLVGLVCLIRYQRVCSVSARLLTEVYQQHWQLHLFMC